MKRVLKFGGTSIADAERVRRAAENIARLLHEGDQIAVVVSAQGDDTNMLLQAAYAATEQKIEAQAVFALAAMGEEKSVRLMTAALQSLGIEAVPFWPAAATTWPLIVDGEGGGMLVAQKINEERSLYVQDDVSHRLFAKHVL